jgi:glucose-1-phosphate adenylyltransferase
MDNVRIGRGARVVNAIVDKNVTVPDGYEIGVDLEADAKAGFTVTDEGITVLGKGQRIAGTYSGAR